MNLYTDIDPDCCAWIEQLVIDNLIPPGHVLCKSITDISPDELKPYTQVHFFCGIAGWPYALRLAGWPEDQPVWTASCPCQPFSDAGLRKGEKDERHLWPTLFRLIQACRPAVIFGEQVASSEVLGSDTEAAFVNAVQKGNHTLANKLAKRLARSPGFSFTRRWLNGIQDDLESAHYFLWSSDIPSAGIGAPNIRQRLYWVAKSNIGRRDSWNGGKSETPQRESGDRIAEQRGGNDLLANAKSGGLRTDGSTPRQPGHPTQRNPTHGLADSEHDDWGQQVQGREEERRTAARRDSATERLADSKHPIGGTQHEVISEPHRGNGPGWRCPACGSTESECVALFDDGLGGYKCRNCKHYFEWSPSRPGSEIDPGRESTEGCSPVGVGNSSEPRLERSNPELQQSHQTEGRCPSRPGIPDFYSSSIPITLTNGQVKRIPASAQSVLQSMASGLPTSLDPISTASLGYPLATQVPHRKALLKGYGNSVNAQLAATFIKAALQIL